MPLAEQTPSHAASSSNGALRRMPRFFPRWVERGRGRRVEPCLEARRGMLLHGRPRWRLWGAPSVLTTGSRPKPTPTAKLAACARACLHALMQRGGKHLVDLADHGYLRWGPNNAPFIHRPRKRDTRNLRHACKRGLSTRPYCIHLVRIGPPRLLRWGRE